MPDPEFSLEEQDRHLRTQDQEAKKRYRQLADKSFLGWAKKNIKPLESTKRRLDKILCFLTIHDWKNISQEDIQSSEETKTSFTRLHRCERCGKLELKGIEIA